MRKKTAPARLFRFLLVRVVPPAVMVFLAIGYAVIHYTTDSVTGRVEARLEVQHRQAERLLQIRMDNLQSFTRTLAANDLVVNGLVDMQSRNRYLPVFFRSLSVPGPGKAHITLVDYKGRPITSNLQPAAGYAGEPFMTTIAANREYLSIDSERLLFAVPVRYYGLVEGAVVVSYPAAEFSAFFNIETGTDAIAVSDRNGSTVLSRPADRGADAAAYFWETSVLAGYGDIQIVTGTLRKTAMAPVDDLQNFLILSVGLSVVALVASLFLTARIVIRPVVALTAGIQGITRNGRLDRQVGETGPRELRAISAAFNRLIARLQKTMITRAKLEEKVRERTAEIQQMHGQMVIQEKMASVGQLAAGIAHELNNPINFVRTNFATLAENFTDLAEVLDDYRRLVAADTARPGSRSEIAAVKAKEKALQLDAVLEDLPALFAESENGFERVARIIQSMRDFSHVDQTGRLSCFNINKGIEDTLVIARSVYKYHAEVQTKLGELPEIACMPEQLNQVFLNLIVNSAQAIAKKPQSDYGLISIRTWRENENVCCEIADNGPGIPEEIRTRVFEPFFTTKAPGEGTGLGLSISYDLIVCKHKGSLTLDCPTSGGTVFTVRIPSNLEPGGINGENHQ